MIPIVSIVPSLRISYISLQYTACNKRTTRMTSNLLNILWTHSTEGIEPFLLFKIQFLFQVFVIGKRLLARETNKVILLHYHEYPYIQYERTGPSLLRDSYPKSADDTQYISFGTFLRSTSCNTVLSSESSKLTATHIFYTKLVFL